MIFVDYFEKDKISFKDLIKEIAATFLFFIVIGIGMLCCLLVPNVIYGNLKIKEVIKPIVKVTGACLGYSMGFHLGYKCIKDFRDKADKLKKNKEGCLYV